MFHKKSHLFILLISSVLLLVGGVGIYTYVYNKPQVTDTTPSVKYEGTVSKIENTIITLDTPQGTFKIYVYDTTYAAVATGHPNANSITNGYLTKSNLGFLENIKVGSKLLVYGMPDGDSVIASNVYLLND